MQLDYKNFFQSLDTAYIIVASDDPNFTIIEENEAHAQLSMVRPDNVIGKKLFDIFPDISDSYKNSGKSPLLESIRKVIRSGTRDVMNNIEYAIKNEHGDFVQKYWSVTHFPIKNNNNKTIAVYQATEDITDKVLTTKQLESTQYQLKQSLIYGETGTWVWNIAKDKVYVDKVLIRILNLSTSALQDGLSFVDYIATIHPDDRNRVEKGMKNAVKERTLFETEYRTFSSTTSSRWIIFRGKVELDNDGKPSLFTSVLVDITPRKSAEKNLLHLLKASELFSASLNPKKTLKSIASIVVPSVADWCTVDLLNDNGQLERVVTAHKDPEKVAWAEQLADKQGPIDMSQKTGTPQVIRSGEPEFYSVITDEMLVAAAKSKEELKLMRDIGFSSVMISPMKIEGKTIGAVTFISTESHIHFSEKDLEFAKGLANRASLAVYNAKLYHSAQNEIKARTRLQKQLEKTNDSLEKMVKKRTHQLEKLNQGLKEENKRRREIERELNENSKNLTRSNHELEDFAYVASHDLQEPLRKIQAFGDLLESEFHQELGEGVEYLTRMRSAASRMSVLIQDLLAFSRVSTKESPRRLVDLNEIAEDVVADLETRIEETRGVVKLDKLPTVCADTTHMRQLLQNLIGNALKFHREDVPPIVTVSAQQNDVHYVITVADNGIGFEEKYLDRIFSVFQRLHGREQYEGTGIGLAVCRKIVERYGGTITAASKKGKGSTFKVMLPTVSKEKCND